MVLVVQDIGRIVGVLRVGRADYPRRTLLESLFIDGKFHHQGIGRQLVTYFEQDYITRDVKVFKLSAPSSQCHSTKAWALKKINRYALDMQLRSGRVAISADE